QVKRNDPSFLAESRALTSPVAGSSLVQADGDVAAPAVAEPMPEPSDVDESAVTDEVTVPAEPDAGDDLLIVATKLRSQERLAAGRQAEMEGQLQLAAALYGE